MESDGRIRSKDIGTGQVNSRVIDDLRSSNYDGSKIDPENDPGLNGWAVFKSGFMVINEAIVRGKIVAARIISAVIESGSVTVEAGGSIEVENAAGDVIVTLDENGLLVDGAAVVPPPTGAILAFGGSSAPTGYHLCQGQAISRTTFSALFAVIGTAYGVGDGSTTFNVPNLQQRFPLGKATSGVGSTLGDTGGAIDHTHTGPSHTHSGPSHAHTQGNTGSESSHSHSFSDTSSGPSSTASVDANADGIQITVGSTSHNHSVSGTTGAGSSHAHTNPNTNADGTGLTGADGTGATGANNPPFQVVAYIIKH